MPFDTFHGDERRTTEQGFRFHNGIGGLSSFVGVVTADDCGHHEMRHENAQE